MLVDFYGLRFETPQVICYLNSPWRVSALELRLFETVQQIPGVKQERDADELRLFLTDPKTFKQAMHNVCRVLKGWQEEADPGRERRAWRWLLEGDTDDHGYDHTGEPACLWAFLQLGLDRGSIEEPEKAEMVDLNGFGFRIFPHRN